MIVGLLIGFIAGWVAIGVTLSRLNTLDLAKSDAYDPSTATTYGFTSSGCTYRVCTRDWWPPFRSRCKIRSCGGGGNSGSQHLAVKY